MFTGLIETTGRIEKLSKRGNYTLLTVSSSISTEEIAIGESIACDGACLTVTEKVNNLFVVEASQETAALTIVTDYRVGDIINLERALKLGDRLGGHYVTGHVDCRGSIVAIKPVWESTEISVGYDRPFDRFVVDKGSLAINGISLTVTSASSGQASVNIIPHTLKETSVWRWRTGDIVNLEFDLIGKYILNQTASYSSSRVTEKKLKESGW